MYKIKITLVFLSLILLSFNKMSSQIDSNYIKTHYEDAAKKIIAATLADTIGFERISYMCDTFGPRLCGSDNLENALDWLKAQMQKDGFQNITEDPVMVPHWVRGEEWCRLVSPRESDFPILSIGGSVGTEGETIKAEVVVFDDFDDLEKRSAEAVGKIVLFDFPFLNYGQAVQFRVYGATKAAQAGALACLINSVTPMSMNNPHTGMMRYGEATKKIPHVALTTEDAALLRRLYERGQKPVVELFSEAKSYPDAPSRNLMGELPGGEYPNQIIAAGGHIDSWDAGTGAHDDASGCLTVYEALRILKDLNLIPRRTIRSVMWTNEEFGGGGGKVYAEKHSDEDHVLMFEFDSGVFPPSQIRYTGTEKMFNIVKSMQPLLRMIDSIEVVERGGGVDVGPMMKLGVPGMSLNTRDEGKYFWYHHSPTDTIDKIEPEDYNKCVAAIALALYIYADLPIELEKNEQK